MKKESSHQGFHLLSNKLSSTVQLVEHLLGFHMSPCIPGIRPKDAGWCSGHGTATATAAMAGPVAANEFGTATWTHD